MLLHRQISAQLEASFQGHEMDIASELTHHFLRSEPPLQILPYYAILDVISCTRKPLSQEFICLQHVKTALLRTGRRHGQGEIRAECVTLWRLLKAEFFHGDLRNTGTHVSGDFKQTGIPIAIANGGVGAA